LPTPSPGTDPVVWTRAPTVFCPLNNKCTGCKCENCPSGAACQDISKTSSSKLLCLWNYKNRTCSDYEHRNDEGDDGGSAGLIVGLIVAFGALTAFGIVARKRYGGEEASWGGKANTSSTSTSAFSLSTRSIVELLPFARTSSKRKMEAAGPQDTPLSSISKTITGHVGKQTGAWEIPFKRLTLDKKVGAGGAGQVFRGTYSKHTVAIKELFATLIDPSDLQEFKKEAMLLASLRHPNIVMFYGVSENEKAFYIVTEYCPTSLDKLLRKGGYRVDPAKTLKMCAEIADAMTFLHERGIVHRDLKPHNMLLSPDGSIRICDFGIAKTVNSAKERAHMTMQVGSPAYMAPELLGGYGDEDDGNAASFFNAKSDEVYKCDVYSYACVLCALWSGSHIYESMRDPMQVIIGVRLKGLRPQIPKTCPDAVAALMRICWQEKPALRPAFPEIAETLRLLQEEVGVAKLVKKKVRNTLRKVEEDDISGHKKSKSKAFSIVEQVTGVARIDSDGYVYNTKTMKRARK